MSSDGDSTRSNVPALQKVGYASPPIEHQFKKGQSGNPRGRPRGSRGKARLQFDPGHRPTNELILAEAYRPVAIREGDEILEIPAIQAVMRAMGVSAMKGNRLAQKTLAEIVQRVEQAEVQSRMESLESFLTYKMKWTEEIERCERDGRPLPTPLPHPDDVILDFRKGTVNIRGPLTKEEKAEWDKRLERRAESQEEVSYFAEKYRKARDPKSKERWLSDWHLEQRIFDLINDSLPDRYKTKLADRSFHPDASREGKTLAEFVADRKKPKSKRQWS